MKIFLFFLLALIVLPFSAWAENKQGIDSPVDDVKVVTAAAEVVMGEDMTRRQAKIEARNNAERNALEMAGVIVLHSSTLLYDGDVISDLVNSVTKGVITKKDVLEEKCNAESCYVKIRAYVKPIRGENNSRMRFLNYGIRRPEKANAVNNPVFQDKDEIQVKAILDEDAYFNIFSVDQYGKIIKLFPNEYSEHKQISARKEFVFPSDPLRARGVKIRVETPGKQSAAKETVLIVATKKKEYFLDSVSMENHTIHDLMRELAELDQSQWVETTIGYEVRK